MKKLAILALILSIAALGLGVYNTVTAPKPAVPVETAAPAQAAQTDTQYVLYLGTNDKDTNEPVCNPEEAKRVTPVDLRRCIERLDAILARNDYPAARRHLDYWRQEALAGNDLRGLLSIENERMGLFRKIGDEGAALDRTLSVG